MLTRDSSRLFPPVTGGSDSRGSLRPGALFSFRSDVMRSLTPVITSDFGGKRAWTKDQPIRVVDATHPIGTGKMREEVWQDSTGKVVRYNLAFIDCQKCHKDSGRVLGYDSAHGYHHRHWMGAVEAIEFPGYEKLLTRFCKEVFALCKKAKA